MKKISKALLSKKRRTPVSADGIRLKRGSEVFVLFTKNSGKTWSVIQRTIDHTTHRGMVSFSGDNFSMRSWNFAWSLKDQVGDHRIYAIESNALAEAHRRNKEQRGITPNKKSR